MLLYSGENEDNLGPPLPYDMDFLDIAGSEDWRDVTGKGRSFEHGFAIRPEHVGGYGSDGKQFEERITYIDITPDLMKDEPAVRAMCQLRMTFDGAVMLGAGDYKLADLPFHYSKIQSVWTGASDRGFGEDTCLLFDAFKSEDCSGEKIALHRSDKPANTAGHHWEWHKDIKSFRIYPKEGCEEKTGWGPDVPRWPEKPPPVCDLPIEWNMGERVWALFYACTNKQLTFVDDEGNEDYRFETWTQRWRRIWKTEARLLWGMTSDYRMIPYVEPEPPEPLDFNGDWLVTYKAYFGVKDNISVKDNTYTHKGKTHKIVDNKITFPNGSTSHLREAESAPDRIEWLNTKLSLVIWTRKT